MDDDNEVRDRATFYLNVLEQKQKALNAGYILNGESPWLSDEAPAQSCGPSPRSEQAPLPGWGKSEARRFGLGFQDNFMASP